MKTKILALMVLSTLSVAALAEEGKATTETTTPGCATEMTRVSDHQEQTPNKREQKAHNYDRKKATSDKGESNEWLFGIFG